LTSEDAQVTTSAAEDVPYYHRSLNFEALWREYPPAGEYVKKVHRLSRDELRPMRERRFLEQVKRAWQVPFYQRHWGKAGLKPGDIRSLDDLKNIPAYDVRHLRESIALAPPFGDYIGLDPSTDAPLPLVLQTSGGTTGLPRAMIYAPQDREVMNILSSRRMYLQGVRPFDRIQVTLSLGLSNGGLLAREGIWKYSGSYPIMTGSGSATPTRRQLEIMQAWGINVLVGFPAYLRHMALVARDEMAVDPHALRIKCVLTHLGVENREEMQALWNAPVYDTYGTNECGSIAVDCEHRTGMHVFEDAFTVEVNDPETMQPKADGERGTVFLTTFFRHLAPVIRFNSADVSAFVPGSCPCGGTHRRLDRIFGRSDNMIKLRGVNVFPEAIGALVAENRQCNGEYVCLVDRSGADGRDDMTVMVEMKDASVDPSTLERTLEERFREALSVRLIIKAVKKGETDRYTGLSSTSKIKRVVDQRKPA
jgi:phenylacetate-CoA ligase